MKKLKLILAFSTLAISLTLTSCVEDNCKQCRSITSHNDGSDDEVSGYSEYCDTELEEVDGKTLQVGDNTVTYECK
jgi:hypothetical protein